MAESVSGQLGEVNPVYWLATQTGRMGLSYPLEIFCVGFGIAF